jgi:hypothetical protein
MLRSTTLFTYVANFGNTAHCHRMEMKLALWFDCPALYALSHLIYSLRMLCYIQTKCDKGNKKRKHLQKMFPLMHLGGDDGTRTHDPHIANVVLSQLSYIPRRRKLYHAGRDSARVSRQRYASSHSAHHHSAWGIPFSRAARFIAATSKGTRRRLTLRRLPATASIAYSPHGGLRTAISGDGTRS